MRGDTDDQFWAEVDRHGREAHKWWERLARIRSRVQPGFSDEVARRVQGAIREVSTPEQRLVGASLTRKTIDRERLTRRAPYLGRPVSHSRVKPACAPVSPSALPTMCGNHGDC